MKEVQVVNRFGFPEVIMPGTATTFASNTHTHLAMQFCFFPFTFHSLSRILTHMHTGLDRHDLYFTLLQGEFSNKDNISVVITGRLDDGTLLVCERREGACVPLSE